LRGGVLREGGGLGPDEGVEITVRIHDVHGDFELPAVPGVTRTHEDDVLPAARGQGPVPGRSQPAGERLVQVVDEDVVLDHLNRTLSGLLMEGLTPDLLGPRGVRPQPFQHADAGPIRGPVVSDDELEVAIALRHDRFDREAEGLRLPRTGNHDGDSWHSMLLP
jgi:hypothetical protein